MGHLRETASVNFTMIIRVGLVPTRVDRIGTLADFLTKVLSRGQLIHLVQQISRLYTGRSLHGALMRKKWRIEDVRKVIFTKQARGCDEFPSVMDIGIIASDALLQSEQLSTFIQCCLCRRLGEAPD